MAAPPGSRMCLHAPDPTLGPPRVRIEARHRLQRGEHGRVDARGRGEVEVGEVLEAREARLADAALAAAGVAVLELGCEQLSQVAEVALAVAQRRLGERTGLLAHGREVQLAGGRLDLQRRRLLGQGGAHRALPASSPS